MKGFKKVSIIIGIVMVTFLSMNIISRADTSANNIYGSEEDNVLVDSNELNESESFLDSSEIEGSYRGSCDDLQLSVKQLKNKTVLDCDGKVWNYGRLPRAGGFQWMEPVSVPGMINGVLVDDGLCLLRDGSIWSWDALYDFAPFELKFVEHKLGVLPDELEPSDIVKIIKYEDYVLILDDKEVCWYVYGYEKKVSMGCTKLQEATPLLENVKDIGYGFILDNNGKVYWFDITNEDNKDTINLNYIMDNIKQLVSGDNYSLVLDNNGKVFRLGYVVNHYGEYVYDMIPYEIKNIPVMTKLWDTSPLYDFVGIGLDMDNNLICFPLYYDIQYNKVTYNKMDIQDYHDLEFTFRYIIIIKNDKTAKAWFIEPSLENWFNDSKVISPDNINK